MKLKQIVRHVKTLNPDETIWILGDERSWCGESEAAVAAEASGGGPPEDLAAYRYFLEVFLAQDLREDLVNAGEADEERIASRIVQYAINDA